AETQDPSTPVSAPQEPTPGFWGSRISRAGAAKIKHRVLRQAQDGAREPSCAQDAEREQGTGNRKNRLTLTSLRRRLHRLRRLNCRRRRNRRWCLELTTRRWRWKTIR